MSLLKTYYVEASVASTRL